MYSTVSRDESKVNGTVLYQIVVYCTVLYYDLYCTALNRAIILYLVQGQYILYSDSSTLYPTCTTYYSIYRCMWLGGDQNMR